jgi:hypothetical protein
MIFHVLKCLWVAIQNLKLEVPDCVATGDVNGKGAFRFAENITKQSDRGHRGVQAVQA